MQIRHKENWNGVLPPHNLTKGSLKTLINICLLSEDDIMLFNLIEGIYYVLCMLYTRRNSVVRAILDCNLTFFFQLYSLCVCMCVTCICAFCMPPYAQ